METQTKNSNNKTNAISKGSIVFAISGLVLIFLLVLGSWTDNRFGTHMVLDIDLSSSPCWFLCLVSTIGVLVTITGLVFLTLNALGIFKLDENKDKTLKIGGYLLMGAAAFSMALSSISFAAFNWQFFKSQLENGISDTAIAMMTIAIVGITVSLSYVVFGFFYELNTDDKLYLTLRNSSMGLLALGWLVTNVCINSFGSMGGDANVLVSGLTGTDNLLYDISVSIGTGGVVDGTFATWATMAGKNSKDAFIYMIDDVFKITIKGHGGAELWAGGTIIGLPKWWNGLWTTGVANKTIALPAISLPLSLQQIIQDSADTLLPALSKELLELSTGKEGMIMGVNNSFNSYAIFTLLVLGGTVGLPLYGYLTYNSASEDKLSVMYWGSIITIAAVSALYLFLALTPYMVKGAPEAGLIGMLLDGNFAPSIAPGLIALPGEPGGIHSAIVYFSDEYHGTIIWWISEVLIFAIPVASYLGTLMYVNSVSK